MLCTRHQLLIGEKIKRMRCVGHVTRMGERRGAREFWWENLREGHLLEDSH